MTSKNNALENDLAYLKGLAELGQQAPLQMGPYLVAGGGWFGAAATILSLSQLGLIGFSVAMINWVWLMAALGFGATLVALIRRDLVKGEPGHNRLINAVWSAAGFGIFIFWGAVTLMAFQLDQGVVLSTISLAVLVVYGVAWWTIGTLTRSQWMRAIAVTSFLAAWAMAWATGTQFEWLAYAVAVVAVALIPGLYVIRIRGKIT
ncbi:MAG TPA: hypothetical protein VIC53_03225 [Wenzhouxiangella sp.]